VVAEIGAVAVAGPGLPQVLDQDAGALSDSRPCITVRRLTRQLGWTANSRVTQSAHNRVPPTPQNRTSALWYFWSGIFG